VKPDGTIWVCAACGKESEDRVNAIGPRSGGWDESCFLKAVLCEVSSIRRIGGVGRVIGAEAVNRDGYEGGRPDAFEQRYRPGRA
jgi:hypothetical protein